ncbi:NUDIX domain-containing protein [Halorubrum sp. SD626R]|uniref:GDP-mannose mannosyl hydrolase n=1 Tax=Halorubrum TaxID=56688 RepID=UPI0010F83E3E|nr:MULTISPECIES: NUDIX domain-containing protein [Halorubrum]TKX78488.1 NUDIX domain-containing protein [Halorubrum sp. SD626R]
MDDGWIPDEDWRTIVATVPIVSVDLVIRRDGGVLLGRRTNDPAKGHWFVPGGRVRKGETRREAVHRVASEELGIDVEIVESLGAFEHQYETADVDGVDSKHYLANGYVVDIAGGVGTDGVDADEQLTADDQHDAFRVFRSPPEPCHEYVRDYVEAAATVDAWSV